MRKYAPVLGDQRAALEQMPQKNYMRAIDQVLGDQRTIDRSIESDGPC